MDIISAHDTISISVVGRDARRSVDGARVTSLDSRILIPLTGYRSLACYIHGDDV